MEPEQFMPAFMVVRLRRTTKKRYDMMAKSEKVTARRHDIGFLVEDEPYRLLFVVEDGNYYEGPVAKEYTASMFLERPTRGVEVKANIVFPTQSMWERFNG